MSWRQSKKQIRSKVPVVALGVGLLERGPVADPRLLGPLPGRLDRRAVEVEPPDPRRRVGVGHHDRRGAVPAADVGHPGPGPQLLLDPVERRNPLRREVRPVARPEEPLRALEQAGVVLAPRHAAAAPEGVGDLGDVVEHRRRGRSCPGLRRPAPTRRPAARRLPGGGRSGPASPSQVMIPPATWPSSHSWVRRTLQPALPARSSAVIGPRLGQHLVQPQFVAEEDGEAHHPPGHRADHLTHELFEGGLVDRFCHGDLLSRASVSRERYREGMELLHRRYRYTW